MPLNLPRFSVRQLLIWLVLMQAAFGVRLAAAQWWEGRLPQGQKFGFGDSEGYWELARTIAKGEPYKYQDYQVFRTPGYPLLLAPLYWLAGNEEPPVMWGRILGALLGTLAVALVVLLAWKLFDERTAWIAGLIATLYPGQIASSVFILSEAPFMPLMLAQLYAWVCAAQSQTRAKTLAWSALAGVLCGAAVLVRPSWLLFVPFSIPLILLFTRERWKHLQIVGVMMLALCLTMTPWWVRNYQVTGTFVPTTLQVGISLADGWNPEADGGSNLSVFQGTVLDTQMKHTRYRSLWESGSHTLYLDVQPEFETELNEKFRIRAVTWAKKNPTRVLQLAGIKFLRMWNIIPNASEFGSWKIRAIYAATYTPLLICCFLGLWKFRRRGFAIWLLVLPAIYFTLLHMIFVASIRYQQPAILAWSLLAAAWLGSLRLTVRPMTGVSVNVRV
jgi:4-amino-4-deoxy-L-arabinose transferase-like glycosyltransferase